MKRLLLIFGMLFTTILFGQTSDTLQISEARNFILENLDGDFIELSEEIGSGPIIINFWATWCKPCKEEMKEMNKIFNQYKEKGLKLFAISIDNEKSVSKVKPYVKTNGFDFTVLLDPNSEVARQYYARLVPYTVVLDLEGKVVYSHLGYKKGDEIKVEKIITDLLAS